MLKLVLALLLVGCPGGPPPPPVESRCNCPPPRVCHRQKWQTLIDVAVESSAQQGVACAIGCRDAPITPKQATAIVDWYCAREEAQPQTTAVWLAIDGSEKDAGVFWEDGKAPSYDLRLGSWVRASKNRDDFPYEMDSQGRVTTKVKLDVVIGGGDSGPMAIWIDFFFDASDKIFGVNLGAGSACPFIATSFDGAPFVERGEILTDLRSPSLEATQDLSAAGPARCTRAIVRVLERKPETTYLDSIALEVDGVALAPVGCPGAAYCSDDGVYHQIEQDRSIDVAFDLPRGADCRSARVIANGYYVPYR